MMRVSAGIIRRADGRCLICRRGMDKANGGLWEFPGGKQEQGETAEDCLVRELREELLLDIRNPHTVATQEHGGIIFDFVSCETDGEPTLTEHGAYAWVTMRDMLKYHFCPADTEVARRLALNEPALTAFFWDFDGTLMDTYPPLVRVFMQACRRCGIEETEEHVLDLMKDNLRRAIRSVGEANGMTFEEFNAVFREEEKSITYDEMKPLPGIPETLRTLKERGGRHFLLTHRGGEAWDFLEHAGLKEYFEGGVVLEDGFPRKPHPESMTWLMNRYGVRPEEAIMIGDRPLDTAAGRNAGAISCLIDVECRFPGDPCEIMLDDARQLLSALVPEKLVL